LGNVEQQVACEDRMEAKGNLYEMPKTARSSEHQPLRILPA